MSETNNYTDNGNYLKQGIKLFGKTLISINSDSNSGIPTVAEVKESFSEVSHCNKEEEQTQKTLKKPDKIIPCPRCKSWETKFCYFNNYNVKQPRHFCKNCQRYWTAGGIIRNVPFGAGRRKNKLLASQYRRLIDSDQTLTRKVLKFEPDQVQEQLVDANSKEKEQLSCKSFLKESGNGQRVELRGNEQAMSQPPHCFPVVPQLVFSWNPGWNSVASAEVSNHNQPVWVQSANDLNKVQYYPTPVLAIPGSCPSTIPLQLVPPSYWSCLPTRSSNVSSAIGEHPRDVDYEDQETPEKSFSALKTTKIDDPKEPSKSSKEDFAVKGCVIGNLAHKIEGKRHILYSPSVLDANPAALSHSQTFQQCT
ncbi:hypothetical protein UlMin_006769 [Ulmus minor]